LAPRAQVSEHGVDAILVDQAQGCAGYPQANPAVFALDPETAVLQVRHEPALGFVVGVGNVVPDHRALARDFTYACHEDTPIETAATAVGASPRQQRVAVTRFADDTQPRRMDQ